MKRPRLSLPLVLTMPVDVILKIAFSIPNAADFFAFLESLHPYGVLGPLEHLYQLSLTQRQSELWPNLKIYSMALKQERRTHYEIIAKYYPKVMLDDILNVQWVKKLDIQKIVLALYNQCVDIDDWIHLPVTEFSWISFFDFTKTWTRVLPQFNHLTTLKVSTRDGYVFNEVCAFAAKSERLIHLEINYGFERVTSLAAQSLIEWFHRPVQFFSFAGPGWSGIDDNDLKQEFYRAMFNCPTLQTLKLHRCSLKDLNLSQLDFSIKSLLVQRCHVNRLFLKSLTERFGNIQNIVSWFARLYFDGSTKWWFVSFTATFAALVDETLILVRRHDPKFRVDPAGPLAGTLPIIIIGISSTFLIQSGSGQVCKGYTKQPDDL
ncbi:hypothetical protein Ae201684P_006916 [Aphanomyces euteiches]|uniref:F-box domain-containing protein n=1 Tax=Aphanomyces euteiches TaxID=100861 RepID=A0A6G0W8H6_9STRA|nr:hypothetical protein Ae201684_017669 [Aphanomyces euteiches]KAH9100722.1 hypothetical protein Ae201684P_006916 [Aphanomyces euteiches]